MTAEILTIPCRSDNYAFLMRCSQTGIVALFDAPEAAPILAVLAEKGWNLDFVFLTHHHPDHIEGLAGLQAEFSPKIIGSKQDSHRLPPLDIAVDEGDRVSVGALTGTVYDVSGHTINHIAFCFDPDNGNAMFTGDSLMALGCGRVFEGDMKMMWESLSKLARQPAETMVYSGHEYTQANGRFAITIEPENADLQARIADIADKRQQGIATVPSLLALELATNPFLRAGTAERFAKIRAAKDRF